MVIYKNRLKSDLTPEQQVLKLGLMNVRVKRHYDAIFSKYGKDKVFAVWNTIPEAQQNYIRGVVEGTLKPVPDLEDITSQILAAKDLVELQEIKAEVMADYGKSTLIKAWEMIPEKEQKRITIMSQPTNSDSKPTATTAESKEEQPLPEELADNWEPQPQPQPQTKDELQAKDETKTIHQPEIKPEVIEEVKESENPSLIQLWQAFTWAESDEEVDELMSQLHGKVDAMQYIYNKLEIHKKSAEAARKAALEETERIYSEPIRKVEAAQRQMENYLLWQREKGNLPQDELVGNQAVIRFRKYESIGELNVEPIELPDDYKRETYTIKPNKQALLEAHKSGEDISAYAEVNSSVKVQFKFKSLVNRKSKQEEPKSVEEANVSSTSSNESRQREQPQLTEEQLKALKKPQLVELAQNSRVELKSNDTKAVIIEKLLERANQ